MQEDASQGAMAWKKDLEAAWREIPRPYRNEYSVRRTLQCHLYGMLRQQGFRVVADYMPPRTHDRSIDLIALNEEQHIVFAVCLDTLVTLAAVKSLTSFESTNKVILTMGLLEKKVNESRFFLKPEVEHVHLRS
jgi:hypothetical protein